MKRSWPVGSAPNQAVLFQPTGHVEALDLGHERQDVPGGVLCTEDVVMPPLDGRKVRLTGGAVEELGEVLVKLVR